MKNISPIFIFIARAALFLLTLFLSYTFGRSCYVMLSGHDKIVAAFNKYGDLSQRETVAVLEGVGALLILIPRMALVGASLLIITIIAIMMANMTSIGGVPTAPVTMFMLCISLLIVHICFHLNRLLKRTE